MFENFSIKLLIFKQIEQIYKQFLIHFQTGIHNINANLIQIKN